MKRFDLSVGGKSWEGWLFGPYGRAKEWRLLAPSGDSIQAGEISMLRALLIDNDYLKTTINRLMFIMRPALSKDELVSLGAAIDTLQRLMSDLTTSGRYPVNSRRRAHVPLHLFGYDQASTGKAL